VEPGGGVALSLDSKMSSWRNNKSRGSTASAAAYLAKNKSARRAKKSVSRLTKPVPQTRGVPYSSVSLSAAGVGFPDQLYMTHAYEEVVQLAAGASFLAAVQKQWRLNSLYDPNKSGSGLQPPLYDNMIALYKRYRVYAADVKVTFVNYGTDYVRAGFYMTETDDTSTPGAWTAATYTLDAMKPNRVAYKMLGRGANSNNATPEIGIVKKKFDFRSICGKEIMQDDDYSAAGGNPAQIFYLSIGGANMTGTGGSYPLVLDARVSIKFHVVWDQLIAEEQVTND